MEGKPKEDPDESELCRSLRLRLIQHKTPIPVVKGDQRREHLATATGIHHLSQVPLFER